MAAALGRARPPVAAGDVRGAAGRSPGSPEKEREGLPGPEKSLEHTPQALRGGRLCAGTDRRPSAAAARGWGHWPAVSPGVCSERTRGPATAAPRAEAAS